MRDRIVLNFYPGLQFTFPQSIMQAPGLHNDLFCLSHDVIFIYVYNSVCRVLCSLVKCSVP